MALHARPRMAAWAAVFAALIACGAAGAGPKKKTPPAKPINLNRATSGELQELPGVGPVTARTIILFREKSGWFKRVEDLLAVRGISRRRFEKIRPYVFVGPPPEKKRPEGNGEEKRAPKKTAGLAPPLFRTVDV